MLRNITDFVRGLAIGLVVGGAAGVLLAPDSAEKPLSALEERWQVAQTAFREGRAQAEKELLAYFERARSASSEE